MKKILRRMAWCFGCIALAAFVQAAAQETMPENAGSDSAAPASVETENQNTPAAEIKTPEMPELPIPVLGDPGLEIVKPGKTGLLNEGGDITISADRMEMRLHQMLELEGNVLVEDQVKSLTAARMAVHLDNDNRPVKIEALDGVTIRLLKENSSATGDRGTYDCDKKIVVLDGHCKVMFGDRMMSSQQVVFDLTTNSISVKRSIITLPMKGQASGNPLKGLMPASKE